MSNDYNKIIEDAVQWLLAHDKRVTLDSVQTVCKKEYNLYVAPVTVAKHLERRIENYINSIGGVK